MRGVPLPIRWNDLTVFCQKRQRIRPMPHPLTVYLDSSDYSNLASASGEPAYPGHDRLLAVLERLQVAREQGRAIPRFSYPVVMEIYPTAPEHLPHALARARAVMDVCGQHCMTDFRTLFADEAQAAALGSVPLRREAAWRDDGAWHPNVDEIVGDLVRGWSDEVNRTLKQMLREETGLNRATRRSLAKRALRKNGSLTPELTASLSAEQRRGLSLEAAKRLQLPQRIVDEDIPARVILGELPVSALADCAVEVLRTLPALFAQDAAREYENEIFHWVRRLGSSISEPLQEVRQKMLSAVTNLGLSRFRQLTEQMGDLRAAKDWLPTTRSRILDGLWDAERKRWLALRVTRRDWDAKVVASPIGTMPGLDALLTAAREHLLDALRPSAQPRQPRSSDGGDLLHMLYLPYVDVFRCDGYAARTARAVVERFRLTARVVATPEQLLDAIEAQPNCS